MTVAAQAEGRRTSGIHNTLVIARRNLLHIKSDPEQIVGMTIQPLMFIALFVFVFGGAIAGSSKDYMQFALPGLLVQSITFGSFTTALGLNVDFQKGLVERFRSLPIARWAVIAGRIAADTVRVLWAIAIILGIGVALGFRFTGGVVPTIGALVLVTAFGITMAWPMAYLGITLKTPEAVNQSGFLLVLPLTFASSVFAPPETMPGWLQAFVRVNPLTHVVDATRGLMLGGPVAGDLAWAAAWMIGIVGVFAPLAASRYRKRS